MAAVLALPSSPIPSISISFAPPEALPAEPFSPFDNIAFDSTGDLDSPRATHLTLPMMGSPRHPSPLSSGGRKASAAGGKGLDRARFESLLRNTRERALSQQAHQAQQQQQQQHPVRPGVSANGALDLRKMAALKAHSTKRADRRALFLSKIEAPPSPSATDVPVTPPESPAVLHYSLPSPGLQSPISLFETLALIDPPQKRPGWIERVEFNAPKSTHLAPTAPLSPRKPLPSLDQISARISSQHKQQHQQPGPKRVRLPIGAAAAPTAVRAPIPLPAFLRTQQRSPSPPSPHRETHIPVSPAAPARLPLPSLGGSIQRGPTPPPAPHPRFNERVTVMPAQEAPSARPARSRRASEYGAAAVTQANLNAHDSRSEMSKAMLEKIMRRVSSPAEVEGAGKRKGEVFGEHRMLAAPGGF